MRAPLELRLAAALLTGGALAFLLVALGLQLEEGGDGLWQLPLLQLAVALGIAGGVLTGIRMARYAGIAVALIVGIMHMLFVLVPAPWWARVVSGVIAAAHVYAAVLLNTKPAIEHTAGARGARR